MEAQDHARGGARDGLRGVSRGGIGTCWGRPGARRRFILRGPFGVCYRGDRTGLAQDMLKQSLRRIVSLDAFILVSGVLFWYLRALYWRNHEEPFSDIWGYVVTGGNIAQHFFF